MIAGVALALGLALAPVDAAVPAVAADAPPPAGSVADVAPSAPARASPSAPNAAIAPDPTDVDELERSPFDGGHTGWRHAIGLGPHSTTFFSKEGSQYTFHSGSLGYLGSLGDRGAFMQLFWLWPLQARQDGNIYATANYYRRRAGGDLLLGPEMRWTFRGAEAEAGPGLHGTFIYLPAKRGYADFSALPLGVGAGGILRWRTRAERLSRVVMVGTYASVAYDFWDPMHAGDLEHGLTFRIGAIVGLGGRL